MTASLTKLHKFNSDVQCGLDTNSAFKFVGSGEGLYANHLINRDCLTGGTTAGAFLCNDTSANRYITELSVASFPIGSSVAPGMVAGYGTNPAQSKTGTPYAVTYWGTEAAVGTTAYYISSVPATTSGSTSNQFLQNNGSTAAPSWYASNYLAVTDTLVQRPAASTTPVELTFLSLKNNGVLALDGAGTTTPYVLTLPSATASNNGVFTTHAIIQNMYAAAAATTVFFTLNVPTTAANTGNNLVIDCNFNFSVKSATVSDYGMIKFSTKAVKVGAGITISALPAMDLVDVQTAGTSYDTLDMAVVSSGTSININLINLPSSAVQRTGHCALSVLSTYFTV